VEDVIEKIVAALKAGADPSDLIRKGIESGRSEAEARGVVAKAQRQMVRERLATADLSSPLSEYAIDRATAHIANFLDDESLADLNAILHSLNPKLRPLTVRDVAIVGILTALNVAKHEDGASPYRAYSNSPLLPTFDNRHTRVCLEALIGAGILSVVKESSRGQCRCYKVLDSTFSALCGAPKKTSHT
jgi:hypothetical protein